MHNPPPGSDEHKNNSLQRRKRQAVPLRHQETPYYSDEHPEIPKIRRASLSLDQTRQQTGVEEDEQADIHERIRHTRRTPRLRPPQREINKIPEARHPHNRVYTPPPPARHRPRARQRRSFTNLSRRQPIIIIGMLLLAILIIGVIAFNAARSQTTSKDISSNGGTVPTGIQQSGNPYELIILPTDTDHPAPPVFAASAYLLDADTGATLYAYNPFMHLPMMSTTKLMTAVLAIEYGNLDQQITITAALNNDISHLSADSTLFGLKKGETYTLRDMLYGLLLLSGNDAAIAIADTLAGNLPNFVAQMNQRAHQLGLLDTHYMNPHGLLATDHYSSARDLAILGRYSMSLPLLHKISGTETYVIPKTATHPEHDLINGNQFLWWYPGVDGGKPGYDGASNFVQVISCTRNHHHLIGVVMHTINWWTDMRDLMNWGFDNFTWISPHDVDSQQNPIPFDYLWNYFVSDKKESTVDTRLGRYYIYTGFSVSGAILTYFDQKGGLHHFGYPTSLPTASDKSLLIQHFTQGTIQCDLTSKQCTSQ
ncbi:MAG TPA: D-alanyl-D-alanine carboxypeptidase family protein [Ktedonobacteraceae bacterium]|nr:D-alanyl-D-alanine carboxypeptidase family protein [Ktedonobacteraceae bacterium]